MKINNILPKKKLLWKKNARYGKALSKKYASIYLKIIQNQALGQILIMTSHTPISSILLTSTTVISVLQ
jgi:hypothetical protein